MLPSIHAGDTLSAVMQSDCIFDIHRLLLETGYMYIYRFGETSAARQDSVSHETARAVQCPLCGATTIPDKHGCCEYCGGAIV